MAELGQGLGLDLADALARDAKLAADFLERAGMSVDKSKAQLNNLALTIGKRVEHLGELLLQHGEAGGIGRNDGLGVLDKVAQLGILFLADRSLERHGLLRDLLDLADAVGTHVHLGTDLLGGRVATQILEELALHADKLVDGLDHVYGNTDGTGLVGDSARDGLTDPPRGVRGELEALLVVELLDGADQTEVALLDQIQEQHAATDVALGDGDDQTEVGADERLLGLEAHVLDTSQTTHLGASELDLARLGGLELLGGLETGLDLHGQIDLFGGGQQVDLADLLKVHTNRVTGQHHRGGIDATHARTRTGRADGALLFALARTHLGIGLTGHLKLMIVERAGIVLLVVIEIVGIVIVIVDVHGGVVVSARGDNLDAAVAQRGIDRVELLVRNIDILQDDLDLVLGYRSPV